MGRELSVYASTVPSGQRVWRFNQPTEDEQLRDWTGVLSPVGRIGECEVWEIVKQDRGLTAGMCRHLVGRLARYRQSEVAVVETGKLNLAVIANITEMVGEFSLAEEEKEVVDESGEESGAEASSESDETGSLSGPVQGHPQRDEEQDPGSGGPVEGLTLPSGKSTGN
jgi:hypothetical protein